MNDSLEKPGPRSAIYKFLAHAYSSPEQPLLEGVSPALLKAAFHDLGLSSLDRELEDMASHLPNPQEPLGLSLEYTRLFRGPVQAEVYPYESMYVDGEIMGRAALDVVRRYAQAGVEVSAGFRDLPDHICAELEFMCYLCAQEFEALRNEKGEEAAQYRAMGYSFLKEHLSRWVSQFANGILQHAATPYYLSLARITRDFISHEASVASLEAVA